MENPIFDNDPIEPLELLRALVAQVKEHDGGRTWHHGENTEWTSAVREGLKKIASGLQAKTICVYSGFAPGGREFLLDIVWWSEIGGQGASLACECEWYWWRSFRPANYPLHVGEDFEKLLVFKAPLKLVIIATPKDYLEIQQAVIDEINKYLAGYKHHVAGEKYLVLDFALINKVNKAWIANVRSSGASRPQLEEVEL